MKRLLINFFKKIFLLFFIITMARALAEIFRKEDTKKAIDLSSNDFNWNEQCSNGFSYQAITGHLDNLQYPDIKYFYHLAVKTSAQDLIEAKERGALKVLMNELRERIEKGESVEDVIKEKANDFQLQLPSEYFEKDPESGSFILNPKKNAAEAMDFLLRCKPGQCFLECQSITLYSHYRTLLNFLRGFYGESKGNEIFNSFFGNGQPDFPKSRLLMISHYGVLPNLNEMVSSSAYLGFLCVNPIDYFVDRGTQCVDLANCDIPIGTQVYFKNHENYLVKHYAGTLQGINAVFWGHNENHQRLFWCFDCEGLETEEQIRARLVAAYNAPPDPLDTHLPIMAGVASSGHDRHNINHHTINHNDITVVLPETIQFRHEAVEQLAADHERCLAESNHHLRKRNQKLRKDRDHAFLNNQLRVFSPKRIHLTSSLKVSEKDLKILADKCSFRFLNDKINHRVFVVTQYYQILLQINDFKSGNSIYNVMSHFGPVNLLNHINKLETRQRSTFSPLINTLQRMIGQEEHHRHGYNAQRF